MGWSPCVHFQIAVNVDACFKMMTVIMLATAMVIGHSISSRTELPHLLHGCFQRTKKVVLLAVKMMSNDVDASWRG